MQPHRWNSENREPNTCKPSLDSSVRDLLEMSPSSSKISSLTSSLASMQRRHGHIVRRRQHGSQALSLSERHPFLRAIDNSRPQRSSTSGSYLRDQNSLLPMDASLFANMRRLNVPSPSISSISKQSPSYLASPISGLTAPRVQVNLDGQGRPIQAPSLNIRTNGGTVIRAKIQSS